jgi:two-component system sensor histidine kinase PilS (NtrC family)
VLNAFVERHTRTLRGNKVLIGLRLLLATISLTVLLIQETNFASQPRDAFTAPHPPLYLRAPGVMAMVVCALTILYLLIARRASEAPRWAPRLAFVQIFVDICLISILIWNTGGVNSQFVVLYLVSICSAAFVLKWNVSILTAALATILFSVITISYSMDMIPESFRAQALPEQLRALRNLSVLNFVRLLLLPVCAFFLTSVLAGTLSRRLASARLVHDEILEGIGEGILVVDEECHALYHNREFKRLLNLAEPVGNQKLSCLLDENIEQQARQVIADNTPCRIEIHHKHTDGQLVPFIVRIIPMRDPDGGNARGAILAMDDISAEKKMEELVKHRQRVETMGRISATIAHEIRNPLASIRGAVQEIGRSVTIPDNKKILLEIVLSESDRLDQIITDFLRFARMRSPRFMFTDLARLLDDAKAMLNARNEGRDVAITVSASSCAPLPADPEQLRQVFLNLGVNALQAMSATPRKELSLRATPVSLRHAPGFKPGQVFDRVDRPGVLIEIQDNGPGIPEKVLGQIFEPFFTTKAAGTGLGLAIVDRIVQSHEGLIAVISQESCGTKFCIWLPSDLKVGAATSGPRTAVT